MTRSGRSLNDPLRCQGENTLRKELVRLIAVSKLACLIATIFRYTAKPMPEKQSYRCRHFQR